MTMKALPARVHEIHRHRARRELAPATGVRAGIPEALCCAVSQHQGQSLHQNQKRYVPSGWALRTGKGGTVNHGNCRICHLVSCWYYAPFALCFSLVYVLVTRGLFFFFV